MRSLEKRGGWEKKGGRGGEEENGQVPDGWVSCPLGWGLWSRLGCFAYHQIESVLTGGIGLSNHGLRYVCYGIGQNW